MLNPKEKQIILDWLKEHENQNDYVGLTNNLSSVTLDGGFNLEKLVTQLHNLYFPQKQIHRLDIHLRK